MDLRVSWFVYFSSIVISSLVSLTVRSIKRCINTCSVGFAICLRYIDLLFRENAPKILL
ncbi:hypothetical protein SETIT_7G141300v2 [Setaria italica]|uniref:Uncharacterized protein n=1 Tax=Setaria italica TaxID=4555 RepID=A0A368RVR2_SETIT|nr:hypothetical protein SETIT_7G141300v2 [Setaria italica]